MAERPLLADALDLEDWLNTDRNLAYETRLERDRSIGRTLDEKDPLQRLLMWWRAVSQRSAEEADSPTGMRVVRLRALFSLILSLVGLLMGGFVASAALAYDGSYPVNLLMLLGVLVGVPALLLVLTLLALPGWLPGGRLLGDAFAAFSLGRWAMSWLARAVSSTQTTLLFDPSRYSRFTRWQLVVFSQWFAVGFFAGVLLAMWLLVAFTDLAFGWSTTLQLRSDDVHRAFALLAMPWTGWLPAAVPDQALTEASRYLRGADIAAPERLGGWWPFVMMAVLCYGLLPRLLLLIAGAWRLRAATRHWLLDSPEVVALLDRLDSPSLTFTAEPELAADAQTGRALVPEPLTDAQGVVLLTWNEALVATDARRFASEVLKLPAAEAFEFSTRDSQQQRQQQLAAVAAQPGAQSRLVILAKGWEPPLLEFLDFLEQLRARTPQASIAVAPVDVSGSVIKESDRDVWARTLARSQDPKTYVLAAAGVAVS